MADARRSSVQFRHAGAGQGSPADDEELRTRLQRRLCALAWIMAAISGGEAAVGFGFSAQMQQRMREAPFAPGSPIHYSVVGLLFAAFGFWLRSDRPRSMAWLRRFEVGCFSANAFLIAALLVYDLSTMPGQYVRTPIDIALGHSLYWCLLIVMYGVLVPNTARRTAQGLVLLFVASFAADVWGIVVGNLPSEVALEVLVLRALTVGAAAVITAFGSYRYERIVVLEAEARALGQYQLGKRLGSGGMGEVYLAEHRLLRRPVAIKLVSPEQAGSVEAVARFEREVQATAQLSHPNTVQVFDYGRADDGTFYCVMEFLPGEALDTIVERDGAMSPGRAVRVVSQLCGALAEAHARGLVHRDVKPSNVMLCERGGVPDVAKLLDFGLVIARRGASADARLTSAGVVVGTPEFMAPEQCGDDDAAIGPASDIYALGALTYYLLAGRSPFAGRGAMQMLAAHLYEAPEPPSTYASGIAPALDAAILRCLAKASADRFPNTVSLAAALNAALA